VLPSPFFVVFAELPGPSEGFDIRTQNACSLGAMSIVRGGLPRVFSWNWESSFYAWIVPQLLACTFEKSPSSQEGVDSWWGCRLPLLRAPANWQ
jgi:hypothetical protein